MERHPVIMAIDDRPSELVALTEAIDRRFGRDYRVVPHVRPDEALEDLRALKAAGDEIALVIATSGCRR